MKTRAFTFWQSVAILAGLAILTVALSPVFKRARNNYREASCQSNLKQISLAVKQYVRDYDEKYPLINSGQAGWSGGWMGGIMPYIKAPPRFQCPTEETYMEGTTDYFYNTRMSGQPERKFQSVWTTIMFGDGIANAPRNANISQIPQGWRSNLKSPAYRHREGANYAFADGHVKWLKPDMVTNKKASSTTFSFALW